MFLSDVTALRHIARPIGNDLYSMSSANAKTVETGDPEIDRMYNQSPVITEFAATYQPDVYKTDGDKDSNQKTLDPNEKSRAPLFSKRYFHKNKQDKDWKAENYFA